MAILTKKSKILIKAKLTVSKSYLLGLVYFMISCILRDALIQIIFFRKRGRCQILIFPFFHTLLVIVSCPPCVFGEAQFLSQFDFQPAVSNQFWYSIFCDASNCRAINSLSILSNDQHSQHCSVFLAFLALVKRFSILLNSFFQERILPQVFENYMPQDVLYILA